ncbi:hypothetical protein [Novosphingobium album (ex Hu et al. 2023)]|uniref:Uncharacterized protein n=1 Tax=Novosphingobium album (ex Hu et al. 2023) TaxID=2930093 RepID=A0ABT0B3Z8_9SPHN|nr:hypothetical protein [Novosphingobium album (ex Hu et al. 2023)]MCJ2179782.1 hypothetical protein [Novosphingobium album (ex Hu et al. 2023)]
MRPVSTRKKPDHIGARDLDRDEDPLIWIAVDSNPDASEGGFSGHVPSLPADLGADATHSTGAAHDGLPLPSYLLMPEEEATFGAHGERGEEVLNLEEYSILGEAENVSTVDRDNGSVDQEATGGGKQKEARGGAKGDGSSFETALSDGFVTDLISDARKSAESAREAEERSRLATYEVLGRSYDLAVWVANSPEKLAAQLVFGGDCSEGQMAEYVAILSEARRRNIGQGELVEYLLGLDGGVASLLKGQS